jgi:hypothetical protein
MLKCYAKIFFLSGIFFFFGALYANVNIMDGREAVGEGAALGAFAGLATAGFVGSFHIIKVRRLASGKRRGDIYSLKQVSELRLPLAPDRVFALLQQYFSEVARFNVTGADKLAGVIAGRTSMAFFKGLGNVVTAEVKSDGAEGSAVTIVSKPLLPAGFTDFGENLKIVMDMERYLLGSAHL